MDQYQRSIAKARWKSFTQDGLPVIGSTVLLAFAVLVGLMVLP